MLTICALQAAAPEFGSAVSLRHGWFAPVYNAGWWLDRCNAWNGASQNGTAAPATASPV